MSIRSCIVWFLCGFLFVLGGKSCIAADTDEVALHGTSVVRFARVEKGQELLTRPDAYLQSLGAFDLQIRLRSVDATAEQHTKHLQRQVVPWDEAERQRLSGILAAVRDRLAKFQLPFPDTVWLVKTTGQDQSGAAYCRQNAIVLPERVLKFTTSELERLLLHELFHVLSNQNPALRRAAYALIGFDVIEPVELPASLLDRKITNPDAPQVDCYLWVSYEGETIPAGPILLSKAAFSATEQRSMFELLDFQLVALELAPDKSRATVRMVNNEPLLLSPDRASFYWNIGLNTGYIIHPDEIMAENFVHLMRGDPKVLTPRIVAGLGELLERK